MAALKHSGVRVWFRDTSHTDYEGSTCWVVKENRTAIIYKEENVKTMMLFWTVGDTEIIATVNMMEVRSICFYDKEEKRRP